MRYIERVLTTGRKSAVRGPPSLGHLLGAGPGRDCSFGTGPSAAYAIRTHTEHGWHVLMLARFAGGGVRGRC